MDNAADDRRKALDDVRVIAEAHHETSLAYEAPRVGPDRRSSLADQRLDTARSWAVTHDLAIVRFIARVMLDVRDQQDREPDDPWRADSHSRAAQRVGTELSNLTRLIEAGA